MKVLGMMSGTSMDGLDCCYVDIDMDNNYNLRFNLIDFKMYPFPKEIVKLIVQSLGNNNNVGKTHDELGQFFLECCKNFINKNKLDLISMHGQTISHSNGVYTQQIGNPKYLNDFFNIPVIYDFRSKDIKLGGNGAPLVPFLDWLLYKSKKENTITLNVGGISNLSFVPENGLRKNVLGFDTGPGMCLIDEYVNIIWNKRIDFNAEFSYSGRINYDLLKYLMCDTYIHTIPPKSISTEYYNKQFLLDLMNRFEKISECDFIRTLVNFTAKSIVLNINKFIGNNIKCQLLVSGGGANHPLIIKDLRANIKLNNIEIFNNNKINAESKESFLIALMGYTRYNNIYNNMQSVTGASKLCSYGEVYE